MFKKRNAGDQLLLAVKLNKVSEISRLVALGVNVNSRIDKSGKTVLHYAAFKGQLSSVKALVEAGADLDVTDENGVTPLHRAVIDGHSDIVRVLLEALCSVDKKDENGNSALHEAAWSGYSKCVELLVKARCNVNLHNRTGYTSLHLAAQNCHFKTVEALLKGGANPLAKNNYGDSPLHVAVRYGHVDVCKILLASCQDNLSGQNNDGNTALHIAARMGHEKLVDMLLNAGSKVATRNNVGDTARDIAIQNGFKSIAKKLAPANNKDNWKLFRRSGKERPRSCDLSSMPVESICSTQATTATPLWVPKPQPVDNEGSKAPACSRKKSPPSQNDSSLSSGSDRNNEKGKSKYRVLTIKPSEMCSIERQYSAFLKKRKMRKSSRSRSRSTNRSKEETHRSDPGLYLKSKTATSRHDKSVKKKKSAQSRDDLAITLTPKKDKKDKGLFALFRSTSDPDLTAEMKNGTLLGKKRKDKSLPSKEVNGNGVHYKIPEEVIKEKGETEETKEKRKEKREKGEEKVGKKEKTSKKDREEEKSTKERKEKRRDSEKDKKLSRRDEMEGSEGDCSICQERIRKSKEKSQNKESRHKDKEHRSKYEHRRTRDYHEEDGKERGGHKNADKYDDEKEYSRKKKHYHDKEKEREREKPRRDKHRNHHHHHHRRKSDEYEVDFGPFPCNTANCLTCKESLNRLEAWQERCTAEIESTRRRLEHRLHRLEKKLEEQQSEERHMKDFEYDRVLGRVSDECREVSKSVKDTSGDVKDEIRGLIKGGLTKLELKLGQISTGYNIPFMGFQNRCNPDLGRNCSADRGFRRAVRSRSSPHLGRAPCEDCASALDHGGLMSPVPTPLNVSTSLTSPTNSAVSSRVGSRSSSRASSRGNLSDTGSMETVIEARPVHEEDVLKAVPETILEAQPVMEEGVHNLNETYAASQVQHQRQVQQVEKWWRHKAEEEQRVLYARICELEQMLMNTEMTNGSSEGGSTLYIV